MGGRDFNSSHCESVIICNTSSCTIKGANDTEWKIVTKDTVKKEILTNRVIVEKKVIILTKERQWHKIKWMLLIYPGTSLVIVASICFRADVLKSSYSLCMELTVEQSYFTGPLL